VAVHSLDAKDCQLIRPNILGHEDTSRTHPISRADYSLLTRLREHGWLRAALIIG